MHLYLKGSYTIRGDIHFAPKGQSEFQFTIPSENGLPPVIVVVTSGKETVELLHEADVSAELWSFLHEGKPDAKEMSKSLSHEVSQITQPMTDAYLKILNLIKYLLNQNQLSEQLIADRDFYWSVDKSQWENLPYRHDYVIVSIGTSSPLYETTAQAIQRYIDHALEPLLAMRHIHRAKKESIVRYKWIDATIAAELAIKEFLIRFKPELRAILLEIPSPPLHKLYGSILKAYTGKNSPKVKEIAKGVEIRNILVHNPDIKITRDPEPARSLKISKSEDGFVEINISHEDAEKYVCDIEDAIYDLLCRLYPGQRIFL